MISCLGVVVKRGFLKVAEESGERMRSLTAVVPSPNELIRQLDTEMALRA